MPDDLIIKVTHLKQLSMLKNNWERKCMIYFSIQNELMWSLYKLWTVVRRSLKLASGWNVCTHEEFQSFGGSYLCRNKVLKIVGLGGYHVNV